MKSTSPARLLALVALLTLTGCSRSETAPDRPLARIENLDEAGWERLRADYRGHVLLVNFWATWCEPCREEFPAIVKLHKTYRERGLSVVAISMDEPESVPAIQHYLQATGADFGSYRQKFHDFSALIDTIEPRWGGGIPATFLYDRRGKLVRAWEGATRYKQFEDAVRPLLP